MSSALLGILAISRGQIARSVKKKGKFEEEGVGTNSSEFDTRIELAFQEARSAYLVRKRLCWLPAGQALEQALEQVPEATAEQAPRLAAPDV